MPDTARAIAREMVAEEGWARAVAYMATRVWREICLLAAVIVA